MKYAHRKYLKLLVLSSTLLCCTLLSGCMESTMVATQMVGSKLSVGTQVDDYVIKAKALEAIHDMPDVAKNGNIEITVFNGIVLLLGQVPSYADKDSAAKGIARISGVKVVYNYLDVAPDSGFWAYTEDSLLTARIKTALTGPVNSLHFKIVTDDDTVYLLGKTSKSEGREAAKIASQISGVRKVITAYWYITPNHARIRQYSIKD